MGQLVPFASCLSKVLTSTSSSLSSLEPQHFLMRAVGGTFSKKHLIDIFLVSWDYEARICQKTEAWLGGEGAAGGLVDRYL